jgi:hypothetical protein
MYQGRVKQPGLPAASSLLLSLSLRMMCVCGRPSSVLSVGGSQASSSTAQADSSEVGQITSRGQSAG